MMARIFVCLAFLFAPISLPLAQPVSGSDGPLDCADIQLTGVTNAVDGSIIYSFEGLCLLSARASRDDRDIAPKNPTAGFARIEAIWNAATNEAKEYVQFEGGIEGNLSSAFQCPANPFVTDVTCLLTSIENAATWPIVDRGIRQSDKPLMSARVDPARSSALPGAAPGLPGPGSPGGPKPLIGTSIKDSLARKGQGILEAESLVPVATGQGRIAVQRMPPMEDGWSNDAQLFWQPESVGSRLTLPLDAEVPGGYSITLYVSTGPDYGQLQAYVYFQSSTGGPGQAPTFSETQSADYDGYAPELRPPIPIEFRVPYTDGPMQLVIGLVGQNPSASGLVAGLDRIELSRGDRSESGEQGP